MAEILPASARAGVEPSAVSREAGCAVSVRLSVAPMMDWTSGEGKL